MKRKDVKRVLKRDQWMKDGKVFEKVLFERENDGSNPFTAKPFTIVHLESGDKVMQERFGDEAAAMKAFGGRV